jgi:hypothetical protein
MKKLTILLPVGDAELHISHVLRNSKSCREKEYPTSIDALLEKTSEVKDLADRRQPIFQKDARGDKSPGAIGSYAVLPVRDNSAVDFAVSDETASASIEELYEDVKQHFQDLNLLVETHAEPWRHSSPEKRDRDQVIWESRNLGETWERTAHLSDCSVSTAKERFRLMQRSVDD